MSEDKHTEDKPLADRRAEGDAPQEDDADFAGEHEPGPTDPPNAPEETPGGESEGYSPQTEIP
jgi:hypothetical protein